MTSPLSFNIEQASERLGPAFTVDWLKGHIDEIPHGKTGRGTGRSGRIYFTEAHLAQILLAFEVQPETAPAPGPDDFTPVSRRRSA
jgi:hypothetical protein